MSGIVKRRAQTADGQVMGMANDNPILDTRKYIVKLPDGYESPYMANLIAEICTPNTMQMVTSA